MRNLHRRTSDPLQALTQSCDRLEADLSCPRDVRSGTLGWASPRVAVERSVWRWHVAFARRRSLTERQHLVEHYLPHAHRLARRLHRSGEALDDLEQVAAEGLLLALERFDTTRGLPFLGFANPTILGTLKRHYRDMGWSVRVARRVHDLAGPLRAAEDMLSQDLGRNPTDAEVAGLLGCEVQEIETIRTLEVLRTPGSIDRPYTTPDGEEHSLAERLGADDRAIDLTEKRVAAQQVVDLLGEQHRELLGLYYQDGLTQAEIAQRLGVSQMQISRLLERTMGQLRSHLQS